MPAGRFFFFNMTGGLLGMSLRLRRLRSGAEIYKISGTRSVISLGLFIAAGYALSIFIRRNEVTLCRRAKVPLVIVGNSIRLVSEVELGDALD